MLQKNGSLLTAWSYPPSPDLAAATAAELEALAATAARRPAPLRRRLDVPRRFSPPPGARLCAAGGLPRPGHRAARRRSGAPPTRRREATSSATACWPPPTCRRASLYLAPGGPLRARPPWRRLLAWSELHDTFQSEAAQLERRLSTHLKVVRLGSDELLTHLHACLTGLDHPVKAPAHGAWLDGLLADQPVAGGWMPRVERPGGAHRRHPRFPTRIVLGHPGLPGRPGLRLPRLPPHHPAVAGRRGAPHRPRPPGLVQSAPRRCSWLRELAGGRRRRCPAPHASATTSCSWIRTPAPWRATRRWRRRTTPPAASASACTRRWCWSPSATRRAPTSTPPKWSRRSTTAASPPASKTSTPWRRCAASLPGHGWANLRRPLVSSREPLADLLPVTSVWLRPAAQPVAAVPAAAQLPALLWAATAYAYYRSGSTCTTTTFGHTLVVGGTGAGKSTLLNLLLAQFLRYPRAQQAFSFDVGYSGWLLARVPPAPGTTTPGQRAGGAATRSPPSTAAANGCGRWSGWRVCWRSTASR